tara:strand:- start:2327 stop:2680 length:354 start_codon:yes stop_codon:yes gene_type:complete
MYKKRLLVLFLTVGFLLVACQPKINTTQQSNRTSEQVESLVAEVSCGQCNFELDGSGCNLAIRLKEVSYFVDGISIDDLGDPHDDNGLCNKIRLAKAQGKVKDDRFFATSIELLPIE